MLMRTLILKATRGCNLRCGYCYYINDKTPDYGRVYSDALVERLYERFAAHADRPGETLNLIWHGGEPLMLGRKRFERFIELQSRFFRHATIQNRLQTNGTLIDDEWAVFFLRHRIALGISIDGPPDMHDRLRPTTRGGGSWAAVARGIEVLRRHRIPFGVISVADPALEGHDLFGTVVGNGFNYFDLLLPITNNALQDHAGAARIDMPTTGRVLVDMFRAWVSRDDPAFHVRLFEALMVNAVGGRHNCSNAGLRDEAMGAYAIVETDGDICLDAEFSEIDRNGLGREYSSGLKLSDPDFSFDDAVARIRDRMSRAGMHQIPQACAGCEVASICRGSHPGSRFGDDGSYSHRSAYCEAMLPLSGEVASYLSAHGLKDALVAA